MAGASINREAMLAGQFLLRHLGPDEISRLAASAGMTHFPRQATIFQKGDPGDSLMAVVRGRVKICTYSADGKELVLNIIDHGGLFGELAVLDGQPRSGDAVALEDTDLLVLTRSRLMPVVTRDPEVASRLMGVLCQRLRQTSQQLEDALLREAPSRLARGLLRLADGFGRSEGQGVRLDIKLSQQQIGSLIGVSRESVNKLMMEWARGGIIDVRSGFITILDQDALRDVAEAEL